MLRSRRHVFAWFLVAFVSVCLLTASEKTTPSNPVPAERRPLITTIYTADPSAHVFGGKIYIYPSHDLPNSIPADFWGSQYDMKDYHVFTLADFSTPVIDDGEALNVRDVPWASNEMWAPDAAYKNGTYYLYFPAHDKYGAFRIGAATAKNPAGPFKAEPEPIKGSFSIDPAVFMDDDGRAYMYFGGLWGGQLERFVKNTSGASPGARVAKMAADMLGFDGKVREVVVRGADGSTEGVPAFFEASWMHKYKGKYYFSYSTGPSHQLVYAVGGDPFGPFAYRGVILNPVSGWTTHHSIVEFKGKWYLFYQDDSLSHEDNLRCVKYQELHYDANGDIETMDP